MTVERRVWPVLEMWDTDVPPKVLEALRSCVVAHDDPNEERYVYNICWGDLLFYHGEDGWALDDDTLNETEEWLESMRVQAEMPNTTWFWVRVKVS